MKCPQFSTRQLLVAIGTFGVGIATLIVGLELQHSPHGDAGETVSDLSMIVGLFLMGAGIGSLSGRFKTTFGWGMAFVAIAFIGVWSWIAADIHLLYFAVAVFLIVGTLWLLRRR